MFPVSLNPYFNPTLSFSNPSFINPEWAMRAYAHHAWDPFSAQAYYRGLYPNVSGGIDPSLFNPTANIPSFNYPFQTQSQFPVGFQSQVPIGFGSPATPQSQAPIGFVTPASSQGQIPIGFSPATQGQMPIGFLPQITQGSPMTSPFAFGPTSWFGHLSPSELGFSGQTGHYLSPEFQEFIRAELLRTGKAIRAIATALESDNEQVKTQAQTALTAQFFYALGLLYTRGVIIPRDVPGASTRADDLAPTVAAESFGESLERFAREPLQFRSSTLGELIEKARVCFRVLSAEGEQLERFKEDRFKIEKKRVTA